MFPCRPDKRPYTTHGHKDASTDPDKIRRWWGVYPDALLGVPTGAVSGINVLDIDVKTGSPAAVLARLPERPPETRVHVTRSGGLHYLYAATAAVRSRQGVVPGADTRGDGGYIIWWPAHGGQVEDRTPAPTPAWLAQPTPHKPKATVTLIPGTAPVTWAAERQIIERKLARMDPDCGYEGWYKVGAAIYHESNGAADGLALWDGWSARGSKYKPGECAAKWRSFRTDREDRITWRGAEAAVEADTAASSGPIGVPKGINRVSDLWDKGEEPTVLVLDGAFKLTPGAWLLAGKPKDGKTWLAMNLACAILTGREYLRSKPVAPGGVIYVNLDDSNDRRFVKRFRLMGLDRGAAANLVHVGQVDTEHFKSAYEMTKALLDVSQGVRMVVIDTLGTFRASERKDGVYQQEYEELRQLNELAHANGIVILIVHHFRKGEVSAEYPFESISGTLGLQGGVDGMIVMMRKDAQHPTDPTQDERLAALWYRGRDIEDEGDIGMRLHDGVWSIVGGAGDVLVGPTLKEALRVLKAEPERWFSSKEVAAEIDGGKHETVKKALQRAARARRIDSRPGRDGGYRWKETRS